MTRAIIALLVIILATGLIENLPNEVAGFLGLTLMLSIIGGLIWLMFTLAFKND